MTHPRKWAEYKEGELELILSLVPTRQNISHLSKLLERSEAAICIVYRMAYTNFGNARGFAPDIQRKKIKQARGAVGIDLSTRRDRVLGSRKRMRRS